MSTRGSIVMLVLLLCVGCFWYFHDVKGSEERQEAKDLVESVFPGLEADEITGFKWNDSKGQGSAKSLHFTLADGCWYVTLADGVKYLAANEQTKALAEQLASLKRASVIMENPSPQDLAQYGLAAPRYVLDLEVVEGAGPTPTPTASALPAGQGAQPEASQSAGFSLQVGDLTPDEGGYYVRSAQSGAVVEVASTFCGSLLKPVPELREKAMLSANPADIDEFSIAGPGAEKLSIVSLDSGSSTSSDEEDEALPSQSKWLIQEPGECTADSSLVMDYLWALRGLQVTQFLSAKQAGDFGQVQQTLKFRVEDRQKPLVIEVGGMVPGHQDQVYVRRVDTQELAIVTVPDPKARLFAKVVGDFEDKHVAPVEVAKVVRVEVVTLSDKGEPRNIKAVRIRDGWDVRNPSLVIKDEAKRNKVINDLLYAISDITWTKRANSSAGLDPRMVKASVKLYGEKDKLLGSVLIGAPTAGGFLAGSEGVRQTFVVAKDPSSDWWKAYQSLDAMQPVSASPVVKPTANVNVREQASSAASPVAKPSSQASPVGEASDQAGAGAPTSNTPPGPVSSAEPAGSGN